MKIVGLTGGIGSGKTTVANMFSDLGVPVYIADLEAKKLMNRSKVIKRKLIEIFGHNAYLGDRLNKPYLAKEIFSNTNLLEQMNAIVHPKVASHFKRWVAKQQTAYIINEAAILFENNSYKKYNILITVISSESDRIQRVINRDNSTEAKVKSIMKNQWSDAEKVKLSHYVIKNDILNNTRKQVEEIHKKILKTV